MKREEIVRAWKDEEYRSALGEDELAMLPEHPAGIIELTDADIAVVVGQGGTAGAVCTFITVVTAVISVATTQFSCFNTCENTVNVQGTCGNFSSGCCTPYYPPPNP